MEKQAYLTMLGWDTALWTVLLAEEAKPLLSKGEITTGNIFSIVDPGGIKAFGEGSYVAKLEWVAKNEVASAPLPPPPAPILDGPVIPKPNTPQADNIEEAIVVEEEIASVTVNSGNDTIEVVTEQIPDVISPLLKARIANLVKAGFTDDTIGNVTSPDDIVYPYVNIEEMENTEYSNLIKAKPKTASKKVAKKVEPIVEDSILEADPLMEERILALEAIGFGNNRETLVMSKELLDLPYARIESMPEPVFASVLEKYTEATTVEQAKEKIKEIVKATGAPEDKVHILQTKKIEEKETVSPIQKLAEEAKQIVTDLNDKEAKPKVEEVKTVTETKQPVEPVEIVEEQAKNQEALEKSEKIFPVATEAAAKHFAIADEIVELATAFKKTFYAIAVIKTVLEEELPPAKKMAKIKAAVKNIETNE